MHEKNRKIPQIRLEMWKSEKIFDNGKSFISEICDYLNRYFDIKTSITYPRSKYNLRKDGSITRPIKISIHNENVIKFYEQIGFEGKKQKTLKAHLPD